MIFEFNEKTMESLLHDFLNSKLSPMFYVKDMKTRKKTKHEIEIRTVPKFPAGGINQGIDPLYDGSIEE